MRPSTRRRISSTMRSAGFSSGCRVAGTRAGSPGRRGLGAVGAGPVPDHRVERPSSWLVAPPPAAGVLRAAPDQEDGIDGLGGGDVDVRLASGARDVEPQAAHRLASSGDDLEHPISLEAGDRVAEGGTAVRGARPPPEASAGEVVGRFEPRHVAPSCRGIVNATGAHAVRSSRQPSALSPHGGRTRKAPQGALSRPTPTAATTALRRRRNRKMRAAITSPTAPVRSIAAGSHARLFRRRTL